MKTFHQLKALGVTDREILIYTTLLETGPTTASRVSKVTNQRRTTTYGVLYSLEQKGLVSTCNTETKQIFLATQPKKLVELLEHKKKQLESIIPRLEKIQKSNQEVKQVQLFTGKEGIKAVLLDMLQHTNTTAFLIGVGTKFTEFSPSFVTHYYQLRKERKVKLKAIFADSKEERNFLSDPRIINTKVKFLPKAKFSSSCLIYEGKVAFINYNNGACSCSLVHDIATYKLQKQVFETLWRSSAHE